MRRVAPDGTSSTVLALASGEIVSPAMVVDGAGIVYVFTNRAIRSVHPDGTAVVLATGDYRVSSAAVDASSTLYIATGKPVANAGSSPSLAGVTLLASGQRLVSLQATALALGADGILAAATAWDPGAGLPLVYSVFRMDRSGTQTASFAPTLVGEQSAALGLLASNGGNQALDFSSIATTPGFALDTAATTCAVAAPLGPGNSCVLAPAFSSVSAGKTTGNITIVDNSDGTLGYVHSIELSGIGLPSQAVLSMQPASVGFGNVLLGQASGLISAAVINSGTATGILALPVITGPNAADFAVVGSTCGPALMGGAICSLQLQFMPGALGFRTATLQLAPGSPEAVLSGTGVNAMSGGVEYSFSAHDFGVVPVGNASSLVIFTVVNAGSAPVTVSMPLIGGTDANDFITAANTCSTDHAPAVLPAGGSCTLSLLFAPAASGSRTASLAMSDSRGGAPFTVALTGTGAARAVLASNPAAQDFGRLPVGAQQSALYTVQFAAPSTLAKIAVLFAGAAGRDFQLGSGRTDSCQLRNNVPGETCTVAVNFTPLAPGLRKGALVLTDGAGSTLATAYLSGVGVAPAIAIGPGTLEVIGGLQPLSEILPITLNGSDQISLGAPSSAFSETSNTAVTPVGSAAALALDGAGNLYLADGTGRVFRQSPEGATAVLATHPSLNGLAVDGHGDVYVTDPLHVYKLQPDGTERTLRSYGYLPGSQLSTGPTGGIAIDEAGSAHVHTCYGTAIFAADGVYSAPTGSICGTNATDVLALDASGTEYTARPGGALQGIAVASNGDLVYAARTSGGATLARRHRTEPEPLNFTDTAAGQVS